MLAIKPASTDALRTMNAQHVLIVEDNYDLQTMFAWGFRRANFEVVVASTGSQALMILRDQRPDLIILDMNMPEVSGLEVLQYVRENPVLSTIKVIMVTGNTLASSMPETAAADLLLIKPVNPNELVKIAQQLI
jgi:DNA-binding response OmpR family regulator